MTEYAGSYVNRKVLIQVLQRGICDFAAASCDLIYINKQCLEADFHLV